MLPLDKFSDAAASAMCEKGLSPDAITFAVRMDLDFDGNFGESWLVYEKDARTVHRLLGDPDSIPRKKQKHGHTDLDDYGKIEYAASVSYLDSFSMDYTSDLSVDTCLSSTRLLVLTHETPRPTVDEDLDHEEKDKIYEAWNEGAVTEIKAQSTNATRQRLSETLAGKTIVISGNFTISREAMKELIEAHGGKNAGSVSGKTAWLLAGEKAGPEKLKKAEKLGIPVLSEEGLRAMLENPQHE